MRRSLSSCLETTRMWRRTERASLEKKPSIRLSQEPCLGVKVKSNLPAGCSASQARVSLEICAELLSRIRWIAVSAGYAASRSLRNSMNSRHLGTEGRATAVGDEA